VSQKNHSVGEAKLFLFRSFPTRNLMARLRPIAGVALALAAAACAPEPAAVTANPDPTSLASAPHTELRDRIDSAPNSEIAGEKLNVDLLRRFYARHGFAPVWATHKSKAESLVNAVSRADDHGFAPELFHANVLKSPAGLSALDRELLQTDAFLSYADALARGVMPVERRREDEVLKPEEIDVTATLDRAIGSADPSSVIEALAPSTPTYRALRQALHDARAGLPVGGKPAATRQRDIEVNLERERWLPRHLPADRVWVNVADERVTMYRDNDPVFSSRVVVGQTERRNQSPEFQASIDAVWLNPPWVIPQDIVSLEIMPLIKSDPTYLTKHNMVLQPDGSLQQVASANSGLGVLMFDMRNRFDVYLHDTPSKELFLREDRRISHGCIRVEDPQKLAALLMKQSPDDIKEAIATSGTVRRTLAKPVPVFVVYETAFADADGKLQFRPDAYGRDIEVWQYLHPNQPAVPERMAHR
jgi:murein L,D-transpeptidase YcbB/YkuD